jgi:hypothetical protein
MSQGQLVGAVGPSAPLVRGEQVAPLAPSLPSAPPVHESALASWCAEVSVQLKQTIPQTAASET